MAVEKVEALEPVYRQWADHQAKIDTYLQAEKTHQPGVPADWGGPALPLRQRELQAQAVTIMSTLGSHIREGTNAMVEPQPYDPPKIGYDTTRQRPSSPSPSSSGSGQRAAPPSPVRQGFTSPNEDHPRLSGEPPTPSVPPNRGLPPPVGFPGEPPPIGLVPRFAPVPGEDRPWGAGSQHGL